MSQSDQWTLAQLRTLCRNELADPTGTRTKWSDAELNGYIADWQDILQQDYEFVWGITTATLTSSGGGSQWNFFQWNGSQFNASGSSTTLATVTLANIASNIMRPADVYFICTASSVAGRLVPRNKTDLDVAQRDWRAAPSRDVPVVVYQDDPSTISFWPEPTTALGTVIIEYPVSPLLLGTDTATMQIPAFCRYSCRHYVAYRAHMRFSAMQNLAKAARYRRLWERDHQRIGKVWYSFQPDRAEMARPGGKFNADILNPRTTVIARV